MTNQNRPPTFQILNILMTILFPIKFLYRPGNPKLWIFVIKQEEFSREFPADGLVLTLIQFLRRTRKLQNSFRMNSIRELIFQGRYNNVLE